MGRLFRSITLLEVVDENQPGDQWLVQSHGDSTTQWLVDPQLFQIKNSEVPEIFQSLTPDQIEKLIHHAWELEGHRFTVAKTQFAPAPTTTT